ncbi:MAG: metal-dependent transcriptional regulator [Planctomyces sp.]|nr:metal-dependent transcriptional regulator [Planctomyces sp.]
MPSLTVENYCKAILQISIREGQDQVSTGALANALEVSPGTVTSMLKTLAESELAEYRPYEGVRLTKSGRSLALRMLRRHRLIELFLEQTLGLPWDQVHAEAENMEHAVSDSLIDRIDEFLGKPQYDPHGAPIPRADGTMRGTRRDAVPLSECEPGSRMRISRVLRHSPDFLRHLSQAGLTIGTEVEITDNSAIGGTVSVRTQDRKTHTLGHPAAAQLLVVPE